MPPTSDYRVMRLELKDLVRVVRQIAGVELSKRSLTTRTSCRECDL